MVKKKDNGKMTVAVNEFDRALWKTVAVNEFDRALWNDFRKAALDRGVTVKVLLEEAIKGTLKKQKRR